MRVKDSELIIGNFVHEPKGHTHKVERTAEDTRRVRYGIPLTEEWLVKFGFKKVGNLYINNFVTSSSKALNNVELVIAGDTAILNNSIHVEIKYVHQLQNLYFSLTGQVIIND